METKALKKQMGAAIAMVLVAAIALAASTYAWFVTNNKVEATTSSISAQSNAAFMTITNGATGASGVNTTEVTTNVGEKALYPATFGEQQGATKGKFMTAYGSDVTKTDMAAGTLKLVGTGENAAGSYKEATDGEYALIQQYNISSKGQNLNNLTVSEVAGTVNNSDLKTALRILVTSSDGNTWASYGYNEGQNKYILTASSDASNGEVDFGTVVAGKDTAINVYLFYEGSDTKVYTNNLAKLTSTNNITVTFAATPDTTSKNPIA